MKITEEQIRELAGIFDDIITSDSDAVKSAFHRLAFLSSLAQQTKEESGPFTDMIAKLDWMTREMTEMKRDIQILQNNGQSELFTDSDGPADITINYGTINLTGSGGTMLGGHNYVNIAPLTSNDIVSLGSMDLSTITLTDVGNKT
jgi:predicted RNA-binding protein